jgi:hypothetical protein
MIAGIADGVLSLSLRLLAKLVVGFVEKTLKVDQMLEIFQVLHLFFPLMMVLGRILHP